MINISNICGTGHHSTKEKLNRCVVCGGLFCKKHCKEGKHVCRERTFECRVCHKVRVHPKGMPQGYVKFVCTDCEETEIQVVKKGDYNLKDRTKLL